MGYEFADRLIELRRDRGLSQEELASQLGLSRQAVSKWERAESAPDIANLTALADVYGVSLDELVRGKGAGGQEPAGQPTSNAAAEPEEPCAGEQANPAGAAEAPIAPGAAEATTAPPAASVRRKSPLLTFPYPLLVVLVYLVIGFLFGWWHPGWVIFFTIPFYYWIVSIIRHDPDYIARHEPGAEG